MRKLSAGLFALVTCTLFVSCQKEVSRVEVAALSGTYKFISMQATTSSSAQASLGSEVSRTVSVLQYLTKENSGTVTFDGSKIVSNNLSYSIDTIMTMYSYTNGVLDFSMDMPFQYKVPPSSTTAAYKMISSDSMYFSAGSMFVSGSSQQTLPSGAKIRIEGDNLYMTIRVNQTTSQNTQGIIVVNSIQGLSTTSFKKM